MPRVSGAATGDKSEQAREKERKQIETYQQLESDVRARVGLRILSCAIYESDGVGITDNSERLLQRHPSAHLEATRAESGVLYHLELPATDSAGCHRS